MKTLNLKNQPMSQQIEAFEHMDEWFGRGYNYSALFMDMGTGKSYTAIVQAAKLFAEGKIDSVLIIAPNGIQEQWLDEQFPEHCPVEYSAHLWQNKKTKWYQQNRNLFLNQETDKLKVLAVNVDRFSHGGLKAVPEIVKYVEQGKCLLIIDEATDIKNHKSNRTENITEIGRLADYKLILTGTPVTNSPFDVFAMVNFLRPGFWKVPFSVFQNKYGLMVRDRDKHFLKPVSKKEISMVKSYTNAGVSPEDIASYTGLSESGVRFLQNNPGHDSAFKNLEELKDLIKPFAFFKKKEECLDLPPKMYQTLKCEMSANQTKLYDNLIKNFYAEHDGEELKVSNKLTLALRLQQITGGFFPYRDEDFNALYEPIDKKTPKLEVLKHDIREAGDQKIIIWTRFRAEIEHIHAGLAREFPDKTIRMYYGGIKKEVRAEYKELFQKGEIDILVMNPSVGSMGLNFQISTLQYFYSLSHSVKDRMQAEDRSHRTGQTKPVLYKDIVCKSTVDERILMAVKGKKDLADYFREKNSPKDMFF